MAKKRLRSDRTYSRGPFLAAMFLLFFGSCFGSHDEAGLLAFEARMAASRLLRMCWSSRGLPRLLLAPFTASSEK